MATPLHPDNDRGVRWLFPPPPLAQLTALSWFRPTILLQPPPQSRLCASLPCHPRLVSRARSHCVFSPTSPEAAVAEVTSGLQWLWLTVANPAVVLAWSPTRPHTGALGHPLYLETPAALASGHRLPLPCTTPCSPPASLATPAPSPLLAPSFPCNIKTSEGSRAQTSS